MGGVAKKKRKELIIHADPKGFALAPCEPMVPALARGWDRAPGLQRIRVRTITGKPPSLCVSGAAVAGALGSPSVPRSS